MEMNPTMLGLMMFATTVVAVIALFAVGIVPLWLAAVILVFDGVFTYWVTMKMANSGA